MSNRVLVRVTQEEEKSLRSAAAGCISLWGVMCRVLRVGWDEVGGVPQPPRDIASITGSLHTQLPVRWEPSVDDRFQLAVADQALAGMDDAHRIVIIIIIIYYDYFQGCGKR